MLNNRLNIDQLRAAFASKNRLLICNALQADVAENVLQSLRQDVPWQMAYMENGRPCVFSREKRAAMSDEHWSVIQKKIAALGSQGFQFCYGHYSISDRNLETCRADAYVNAFADFLRSEPFFDFARLITGKPELCNIEILAARYTSGDFLMMHDDTLKTERRVAFVFNFSEEWHPDWGGLTHFLDRDLSVTDTYVPTYNSLLLFTVPVRHIVSYVMPFAPRPRYSVTGWLTV